MDRNKREFLVDKSQDIFPDSRRKSLVKELARILADLETTDYTKASLELLSDAKLYELVERERIDHSIGVIDSAINRLKVCSE